MKYQAICRAILKMAADNKSDYRPLMRKWMKLFMLTRVVGWDRDEFLDDMIVCKKEAEKLL